MFYIPFISTSKASPVGFFGVYVNKPSSSFSKPLYGTNAFVITDVNEQAVNEYISNGSHNSADGHNEILATAKDQALFDFYCAHRQCEGCDYESVPGLNQAVNHLITQYQGIGEECQVSGLSDNPFGIIHALELWRKAFPQAAQHSETFAYLFVRTQLIAMPSTSKKK